jgi:protein O-mannosyl-transferase
MIAAQRVEKSQPARSSVAQILALCGLLGLVFLTYSNHFQNSFHFDDSHAVVENVYVRDPHNIPLIFEDGITSSSLPANRTYRPVVTASLAVDYWMGGGLKPLWFHISTFFWFVVLLGSMMALFRGTLDRVRSSENNFWIAWFATALYGLHPVSAETVNYIIQRADLYSTLGVVAGLAGYTWFPKLRKTGLYLAPVALGILSKAPAAVFPVLLVLWIRLFEEEAWNKALRRSVPAFAVTAMALVLVAKLTPSTFVPGAVSAWAYRMTQPAVLMGYFRKFFLPLDLSADTDRVPVSSIFTVDVIGGLLFLAALIGVAWWCRSRRETRPIAFGLAWFLITSLPTSLTGLAEVENDHRMFMPFVGLALSVTWAAALALEKRRLPRTIVIPACALVLGSFAFGAYERNKVWNTEETLWHDVTIKSPANGRGLMNYGLSLMGEGRMQQALGYFNRALVFNPNYYILEINLGIANTMVANTAEGERHFRRAIDLAPGEAMSRYFYARWLAGVNRRPEAIEQLQMGIRANPDYMESRYLLMQAYADSGKPAELRAQARETLARFPSDGTAASWLTRADKIAAATPLPQAPANAGAADAFIAESLAYYRAGKFRECIAAAQQALKFKPDYAEAWNNIGAAWNQLGEWDKGIEAERQALRLKPDLEIAKNNLAFAAGQKVKGGK